MLAAVFSPSFLFLSFFFLVAHKRIAPGEICVKLFILNKKCLVLFSYVIASTRNYIGMLHTKHRVISNASSKH